MKRRISVEMEFSEEFLSNILITGFDAHYGGCWYWAGPDRVHSPMKNPW